MTEKDSTMPDTPMAHLRAKLEGAASLNSTVASACDFTRSCTLATPLSV